MRPFSIGVEERSSIKVKVKLRAKVIAIVDLKVAVSCGGWRHTNEWVIGVGEVEGELVEILAEIVEVGLGVSHKRLTWSSTR